MGDKADRAEPQQVGDARLAEARSGGRSRDSRDIAALGTAVGARAPPASPSPLRTNARHDASSAFFKPSHRAGEGRVGEGRVGEGVPAVGAALGARRPRPARTRRGQAGRSTLRCAYDQQLGPHPSSTRSGKLEAPRWWLQLPYASVSALATLDRVVVPRTDGVG